MKAEDILSHVDHTLLKADASWKEISTLCEEAALYHTASVCVPSSYVKRIRKGWKDLVITAVVGFPLGHCSTAAKKAEARQAIKDGADEIDMVINLGDVKNSDFDKVTEEIQEIKMVVGKKTLKVIAETCYLTDEEKAAVCRCVTEGGADYIKTSTGFGTKGATLADVKLFKQHVGPSVKIKAAGGIRTKKQMEDFLKAGADRIGASGAVKALKEELLEREAFEQKELEAGMKAPGFTLPSDGGVDVSLSDFLGEKVILYFYPKDNTSGCTLEARAFQLHLADFKKLGYRVLGVSRDSVKKHCQFRDKNDLAFPLLSDESEKVVTAYGVLKEKSMYGRKYMGIVRSTFVIDEKGRLARIYRNVKASSHVDELLFDLADK